MQCYLCLKHSAAANSKYIEFDTEEANVLDLKSIIEQHFWLKLKNAPATSHCICEFCWQNVITFHNFYLSVETAHKVLREMPNKPVNEIKIDPLSKIGDECEEMVLNVETKCKRRRPSRKRQLQRGNLHKDNQKKFAEVMLEEANLDDIKFDTIEVDNTMIDVLEDKNRKYDFDYIENRRQLKNSQKQEKNGSNGVHEELTEVMMEDNIKFEILQSDVDVLENSENIDDFNFIGQSDKNSNMKYDKDVDKDSVDVEATQYRCERQYKQCKIKPERIVSLKTEMTRNYDSYIKAHFKLICHICSMEQTNFTKLLSHFRTQHKQSGYATCCGRKFAKRGLLVDHLHRHENPEYFKCLICDQVLTERYSLDSHMKLHDDKYKERIYKCTKCPKSYYNQTILMRHELTHVPNEKRTVACYHCDKFFPTNYSMKQHYRLVHLNKYAKICDVCGKSLRSKDALERHINEHAGVENIVQCESCGVWLTTKHGLARHKKMMHNAENRKPVTCEICSKVSLNLQAHLKHVQYAHQTQYKHQCPLCEKAFRRNNELKEHLTTHTGDVLYTCPHCPKTFNSNANMYSHRKKYHPKEWEESRLLKYQQRAQGMGSSATSIIALSVQRTIEKAGLENVK